MSAMQVDEVIMPKLPSRILLVEDEDTIRDLAGEFLTEWGYEVATAASAEDAREKLLLGRPFDLLVADIWLPGMNGRALANHTFALHPTTRVLLITGYAGGGNEPSSLRRAGIELLGKPFTMRELLVRVQSIL